VVTAFSPPVRSLTPLEPHSYTRTL
jgi:hypothetical protein